MTGEPPHRDAVIALKAIHTLVFAGELTADVERSIVTRDDEGAQWFARTV